MKDLADFLKLARAIQTGIYRSVLLRHDSFVISNKGKNGVQASAKRASGAIAHAKKTAINLNNQIDELLNEINSLKDQALPIEQQLNVLIDSFEKLQQHLLENNMLLPKHIKLEKALESLLIEAKTLEAQDFTPKGKDEYTSSDSEHSDSDKEVQSSDDESHQAPIITVETPKDTFTAEVLPSDNIRSSKKIVNVVQPVNLADIADIIAAPKFEDEEITSLQKELLEEKRSTNSIKEESLSKILTEIVRLRNDNKEIGTCNAIFTNPKVKNYFVSELEDKESLTDDELLILHRLAPEKVTKPDHKIFIQQILESNNDKQYQEFKSLVEQVSIGKSDITFTCKTQADLSHLLQETEHQVKYEQSHSDVISKTADKKVGHQILDIVLNDGKYFYDYVGPSAGGTTESQRPNSHDLLHQALGGKQVQVSDEQAVDALRYIIQHDADAGKTILESRAVSKLSGKELSELARLNQNGQVADSLLGNATRGSFTKFLASIFKPIGKALGIIDVEVDAITAVKALTSTQREGQYEQGYAYVFADPNPVASFFGFRRDLRSEVAKALNSAESKNSEEFSNADICALGNVALANNDVDFCRQLAGIARFKLFKTENFDAENKNKWQELASVYNRLFEHSPDHESEQKHQKFLAHIRTRDEVQRDNFIRAYTHLEQNIVSAPTQSQKSQPAMEHTDAQQPSNSEMPSDNTSHGISMRNGGSID